MKLIILFLLSLLLTITLSKTPDDDEVDRMALGGSHGDDDGLVHLVADHDANALFSIIALAHSFSPLTR